MSRLTTLGSSKTVSVVWDDITLADGMEYTCEAVYEGETYTRESTLTVVGSEFLAKHFALMGHIYIVYYKCMDF